jgi:tetratricopeptide (TPR) repeat protein
MLSERLDRLQTFLRERPEDPFLHYALLLEWIRLGAEEDAEKALAHLLEQHSDYLGTYYSAGTWLRSRAQVERAAALFRQGLALARAQGDHKTAAELAAALSDLQDEAG